MKKEKRIKSITAYIKATKAQNKELHNYKLQNEDKGLAIGRLTKGPLS